MTTSPAGVALIHSEEACRLSAYLDGGGVPTIGWGTTRYPFGGAVWFGDTCTQEEADRFFDHDLAATEDAINRVVKVPLTQNQFDALASFTYNCGEGALAESTLLKLLNSGASPGIVAMQFPRWDMDGGKSSKGLLTRRVAEQQLFLQA